MPKVGPVLEDSLGLFFKPTLSLTATTGPEKRRFTVLVFPYIAFTSGVQED